MFCQLVSYNKKYLAWSTLFAFAQVCEAHTPDKMPAQNQKEAKQVENKDEPQKLYVLFSQSFAHA